MTVIVVDAAFKAKLLAAGREVELRDETGATFARVTVQGVSADASDGPAEGWDDLELSEEEIARRLDPSQPSYTTEEVLAYVKGRRK